MVATNGMPVIVYYRKSNKSDSQREESVSIGQQRREVREHVQKRGWRIVREEYVDDGKSASRNEHKRESFHRLLADCERPEFRAVLVWDLSRLTRKDSVDAAKAASVFKKNRILVVSLRDGEIDLTTSMGRTIWNLHAESNSEFAKKVSAGTIRGRGDSLARGDWPHGQIPYGYRRQYFEGETLMRDLHRRERAGKARHWSTRLVPDPVEAPFAAKIIKDFATRDISIRGLAAEMTKAGAPTITGNHWTPDNIKTVIRCPAYAGDTAIGYSSGWQRSVDGHGYEALGHSEAQTQENACPALVDRETWQRAYNRLKSQFGRVHTGKASPLSGILVCGHCGCRMAKNVKKGVTRFVCSTAAKNAHNPTCKQWTVREDDLLPIMTRRLVETLDGALLAELQAKPPADQADTLALLHAQAEELEKRVKAASRKLLECNEAIYADVEAALLEMRRELDEKRNTIRAVETSADKSDLERVARWWHETRPTLVPVREPMEVRSTPRTGANGQTVQSLPLDFVDRVIGIRSEPDVFRGLLKRLGAKLTLHFTPKATSPGAKKRYYALEWGQLEAVLDGHSFDATRPAAPPAPTPRR